MNVLTMLEQIHEGRMSVKECVAKAKDKDSDFRLSGFGHRVYKNFDPRSRILKHTCDEMFGALNRRDPLLDIAQELEVQIVVNFQWKDQRTGQLLRQRKGFMAVGRYVPTRPVGESFQVGQHAAAQRLAEQIVATMRSDF